MDLSYLASADPRWSAFVTAHPDSTPFHDPSWSELLHECYGYELGVAATIDGAGQVSAGLPIAEVKSWLTGRRAISLPFTDFCQPLAQDQVAANALTRLLTSEAFAGRWPRLEVRWPLPLGAGLREGAAAARHVTALEADADRLLRRFKSSTLRLIRQAQKSALAVTQAQGWQEVKLFYGLHLETRRRQGVPVQPLRFFRLLWERVLSHGKGHVLLAWKDKTPIAGAVFLHAGRTVIYKYGASLPDFWQLRPNNLLFWTALQWGCEHGFSVFDWGRTDLENEGLRSFKRGWAADESIVHYTVIGSPAAARSSHGLSRHLTPTIQRAPRWVGRTLGELLYGHFA